MSVTNCRDCGETVSRRAKTCPHCGAVKPWRGKVVQGISDFANGMMGLGCLIMLALFFLVLIAGLF